MYFIASTGESVRGNKDFTAAAVVKAATVAGIPCSDELPDSQQPLLDDAGQLAASDTRDLVVRLGLLATAVASGFVRKAGGDDLISERLATLADEPTVENWHRVCKSLRDFVNEDYREHRLSRLMLHTKYVPKGVIKPSYLHMNHAHAAVSNNPERVDRGESVGILHPTWFAVSADLPLVSAADLRNFGIEAFDAAQRSMSGQLVAAENTALLRLLQSASNTRSNQAQVLAGGLDFYMWRRMADSLKVSATSAVLAHSAWMQLVLTARRWPAAISAHYEAPEQHEQAFEGFFGSFAGVDIHTDGHAAPHLRALGREQVIMAIPERSLGIVQYMLNDDNFHVTDNHSAGTYSVGMHMNRLVSMTVLTVDGVAVGTVAK